MNLSADFCPCDERWRCKRFLDVDLRRRETTQVTKRRWQALDYSGPFQPLEIAVTLTIGATEAGMKESVPGTL